MELTKKMKDSVLFTAGVGVRQGDVLSPNLLKSMEYGGEKLLLYIYLEYIIQIIKL